MQWFTADWHIGHSNIVRHSNRPFADVDAMNAAIFESLGKLRPGDSLYFLGDIALRRDQALQALDEVPKGVQVHVVFGNHDRPHHNAIAKHSRVAWSGSMKSVKIEDQHIILCHYAMRTWDRMKYGAWQLFGHSHNNLEPWAQQFDVGVDSAAKLLGEYRPFSFDELQRLVRPISSVVDHHAPGKSE